MIISKNQEKKKQACEMLVLKASELGRLPKKADCSVGDLVFIKAHLGPWPRALEAAGLKESKNPAQQPGGKNHAKRKKHMQGIGNENGNEIKEFDSAEN